MNPAGVSPSRMDLLAMVEALNTWKGSGSASPRDTVEALALHFYATVYCPGRPEAEPSTLDQGWSGGKEAGRVLTEAEGEPGVGSPASGETVHLAATLMRAHRGRPRWDLGWEIEGVEEGGKASLRKGSHRRQAPPGSWQPLPGPGGGATREAALAVPVVLPGVQPGFFHVQGSTPADPHPLEGMVRIYWNVRPEGAPHLLAGATEALDRYRVPFRMKLLEYPHTYANRADPVVMYLARRDLAVVAELLAPIHGKLRRSPGQLRGPVPRFTRRMGRGVGIAEDPPNRESFGLSRCRSVARALVGEGEIAPGGRRLAAVEEALRREGLDLDALHLNPGSADATLLASDAGFFA